LRQRRWESALEANAKAEKFDPNSWFVLGQRSAIMYLTGRPVEALALVESALALDPQDPETIGHAMLQRCRASLALGRYDDAVVACEKNVAVDDWWLPHLYLVAAHTQKGEHNEASAERARLLQLRPGISIAAFKALRYSDDPNYLLQAETQLYAGLRRAGIPEN
jgi:tetratricopeptide (TPR) repeat protein